MKVSFIYLKVYPFFQKKVSKTAFNSILCFVLGVEENYKIYLEDFQSKKISFFQFLKIIFFLYKVYKNYPLQYLIKKSFFFEDYFYVNRHVLIPRPETEELVEKFCQENISLQKKKITILEIGTGSGAIAISLKKKFPLAKVIAIEICSKALVVAKKNAHQILPNQKVEFVLGDFFEIQNQFKDIDFIISNPPYVSFNEKSFLSLNTFYEPKKALFTKKDGYFFYYEFSKSFRKILKDKGKFYLEFGFSQSKKIYHLFSPFYNCSIYKDINRKERFLIGNKKD